MDFSVSMCVYGKDNPEWFRCAVDSILNQTVQPSEVILVVDGPVPDELDKIISKYEEIDFFKVIRFEKNMGHGNARREGLKNCRYELVALMDSDDISVSNRFEKQLEIFNKNKALSVVGGQIDEFYESPDAPIGKRIVPVVDLDIKQYMKKRCPINQPSVMMRKSDIDSVGGYIDWYCNEDYYLWIRLALAGKKFENSDNVLVHMRTTPMSYQRRGGIKYYRSEKKIQRFMRDNKMISEYRFLINVFERLVIQVLLPNRARAWIFKHLAREK